jgi:hypothetical protein
MVAEDWSDAGTIQNRTFGSNANPILHSAFDFPVRYAIVGVVAGEENELSGRPASVISESWALGAHDNVYAAHALPNLMLGNHDLVRYGDLLQRVELANPADPEYWARHRLAFMFQAAYSGPITRYYGEEIGDEVPNYANRVTNNCANLGLCDDHVARTSAKILGVTVNSGQLSANQHALLDFHEELMAARADYSALSHGSRQHLYSDDNLYVDLKSYGDQQIVFAMNVSDQSAVVEIRDDLFDTLPPHAWDILDAQQINFANGYLSFTLSPLSARYVLLADGPLLAGDFNNDGVVDSADYVVWRKGLGTTYTQEHFDVWRANFGQTAGAGSATFPNNANVPEPTTLLLLAAAAATIALRRRR